MMAEILIVEDNRINQIVASRILTQLGVDVDLANDGLEGLEAIKNKKYDLVFMDCQMPNMDGYTAVAEIRKLEQLGEINKIPVVALTAHAMPGDRQKCLDAGMDDYVSKPVSEDGFADMLRKWIGDVSNKAPSNVTQRYRFKHVNAEELEKLFEIMGDGFFALIEVYFSSMKDLVEELSSAILVKDYADIMRCAHTIKSPSRQVGSIALAEKAGEIEEMAKAEGGIDDIRIKFAILREQMISSSEEIARYVDSKKSD